MLTTREGHYMRQLAMVTIGALALVALTAAGADAQSSKCSGNKAKASGKKAEVKFSVAFAKAEAKTYTDAGCLTTGDASPIEGKIDTLTSDVDALVGDG